MPSIIKCCKQFNTATSLPSKSSTLLIIVGWVAIFSNWSCQIILLAHNAKNLPVTVVSRCQNVHISPAYDQETQVWIKKNIEHKEDFDVAQLLEATHGVPFKVIEDLSGDSFIHYQHWQDQLLNIATHPTMINKVEDFEGNEVAVLNCFQHLIIEGIRLKSLKHEGGLIELNQIINPPLC
jgi:DNA polymerase-3 subunit delta'